MTHRAKRPSIQWYTGDWLKDPALGQCSPATRGIWMDMICLMHENGETGELVGTPESLARVCRCTTEEMRIALAELEGTKTADVPLCPQGVLVINRRMRQAHENRVSERNKKRNQRAKKNAAAQQGNAVPEKSTPYSSSSSFTSRSKTPTSSELSVVNSRARAREGGNGAAEDGARGLTPDQRAEAARLNDELERRREALTEDGAGPEHVSARVGLPGSGGDDAD